MTRKNINLDNSISFKSVGEKIKAFNNRKNVVPKQKLPVGIKTPLSLNRSGLFEMNYDLEDQIKDNLRNLLLTNKGERLGNPAFGTDLRKIQYDISNKEEAAIALMAAIQEAVSAFMPFVELQDFKTSEIRSDIKSRDDGSLGPGGQILLRITYTVPKLSNNIIGLQIIVPMGV